MVKGSFLSNSSVELPVRVDHTDRLVRKVAEEAGREIEASVGAAGALLNKTKIRE